MHHDLGSDRFSTVEKGDPRISGRTMSTQAPRYATLGDAFLASELLDRTGMPHVLARTFPDLPERERVACHILHGVMKDGERTSCGDFLLRNVLSSVLDKVAPCTLDSDSHFFSLLGEDSVRTAFFRNYVEEMRKKYPDFGHCCLVDSTPLPGGIDDNPLNCLRPHGVDKASVQMRMIVVLDRDTGLIVWFSVIPGNALDSTGMRYVLEDVEETLGIKIAGEWIASRCEKYEGMTQ